jgi:RNA polymerase sigma-32 factor
MTTKEETYVPVLSEQSGFAKYLQEINKIPSLTPEEEFMLAKNYIEHQDLDAAHKLVTSHLKLVVKIAISYKGYGLPMIDMVSEGNLGLMHAVKKFDPDLGHRLSTYAMWWIKASIQEYVLKSWSMVKIGTTSAQKKLFFSLGKIKTKIRQAHEREINHSDYLQIATDLGVSAKEVIDMDRRLSQGDTSLNNKYGEDEDAEMIEFIPEKSPNQEMMLSAKEDATWKNRILTEALKTLNERELDILSKRKLTETPSTLDELSKAYNMSKERVRQIENRAFEKVQDYVLKQHTASRI